jgi:hypothetical protein
MSTQCLNCKHWIVDRYCKAFPGPKRAGESPVKTSIPLAIWYGEFDHNKKHPDQENDIVFEQYDFGKEK